MRHIIEADLHSNHYHKNEDGVYLSPALNEGYHLVSADYSVDWSHQSIAVDTTLADITITLGAASAAPIADAYNRLHIVNLGVNKVIVTIDGGTTAFQESLTMFEIFAFKEITFSALPSLNSGVWAIKTALELYAYGKNTTSYTADTTGLNMTLSHNDSAEVFVLAANTQSITLNLTSVYNIVASCRFDWSSTHSSGYAYPKLRLYKNASLIFDSGGIGLDRETDDSIVNIIPSFTDEFDTGDVISFSIANIEPGITCSALRINLSTKL